ncbi:MAG: 2-oxoacid:acceptor oxidoreductase family protein [Candidatus Omnitrophota bacterium]|nr:2-oxoacid:acceptor oxidoreductase family protein [Candidatus Omnitrophota bacterium]
MVEHIIIAGAGGQGIMLLGKVLAEAAMREDKYVTWLPSYGAEVRGGTAHCMVVISDAEIGSPYIKEADTLIIMNGPSFKKFKDRIKNKGILIVNSSLARDVKDIDKPIPCPALARKSGACTQERGKRIHMLKYPFTDLAVELGNIRIANMIALGCFISRKNIVDVKSVSQAIRAIAPEDKKGLIEINQKALLEGTKLK